MFKQKASRACYSLPFPISEIPIPTPYQFYKITMLILISCTILKYTETAKTDTNNVIFLNNDTDANTRALGIADTNS